MKNILAFVWGSIFALGLIVSDMINPKTVQSFLDVFGHWNPQLAFVMIGAILVAIVPFQLVKSHKIKNTYFNQPIQLPEKQQIDIKLILGAILFGIGWGMVGICPAPAIALVSLGNIQAYYFMAALFLGMWLYRKF